ncbi:hypothetical protein HMN09_00790200 [Mycena chlorophos]|uniref:Uncharacterized protein n=1 Tax=Mycena chlorophos TaxID=658473 RepID=A0A8H6SWV2_MYCCL|nr:hypothetical protein HMN09_00790200 [Mycena chlorophos]
MLGIAAIRATRRWGRSERPRVEMRSVREQDWLELVHECGGGGGTKSAGSNSEFACADDGNISLGLDVEPIAAGTCPVWSKSSFVDDADVLGPNADKRESLRSKTRSIAVRICLQRVRVAGMRVGTADGQFLFDDGAQWFGNGTKKRSALLGRRQTAFRHEECRSPEEIAVECQERGSGRRLGTVECEYDGV